MIGWLHTFPTGRGQVVGLDGRLSLTPKKLLVHDAVQSIPHTSGERHDQ